MNTDSMLSAQQVKTETDAVLQAFFTERTATAAAISNQYERLWQAMARLNQAGGKRLRPYMTRLSYQVFNGADEALVITPAAAWELVHLCMLIHDDIIDNDLVRYGVPNIAGSYQDIYAPHEANADRRDHLASSAAILAGDLALSSAQKLVLDSQLSDPMKLVALRYITDATFEVAGGELLDTESVLYDLLATDTAAIARYKTASYSCIGPLLMGAELAGVSEEERGQLHRFATELGIAYQLVDDLLGVFGDTAVTGKSTDGDIREGKHTLLMQHAFKHASDTDRATLERLVGKSDITQPEVDSVLAVLISTGAREAVEDQIKTRIAACKQVVAELSQTNQRADELMDLVKLTTKRSY